MLKETDDKLVVNEQDLLDLTLLVHLGLVCEGALCASRALEICGRPHGFEQKLGLGQEGPDLRAVTLALTLCFHSGGLLLLRLWRGVRVEALLRLNQTA